MSSPPVVAYLGLGSNLGDRVAHLRQAVESLRQSVDADLAVSSLWETAPVGGPSQPDFLNCVVRLSTDLSARDLLGVAKRLEREAHRLPTVRNGPRSLDVDVLLYDDEHISEPDLVLPHPRMTERAFVLAPLEELAPLLVPAGWRDALGGPDQVEAAVRRVIDNLQ